MPFARSSKRDFGVDDVRALSEVGLIPIDAMAALELRAIVASLVLARRLGTAGLRPNEVRAQLRTVIDMSQRLHRKIEALASAPDHSTADFAREALASRDGEDALNDLRNELARFASRTRGALAAIPPESWGNKPTAARRAYMRQIAAFYRRRGRATALSFRTGSEQVGGPFLEFARALERLLPPSCRAVSDAELANEVKRVVRVIHSPVRKTKTRDSR